MGRAGICKIRKPDSVCNVKGVRFQRRPFNILLIMPAIILLLIFCANFGCSRIEQTGDHSGGEAILEPKKISGSFSGCLTGAFIGGNDYIAEFEEATGRKLAVVMWYTNFTQDFPRSDCDNVSARNGIPCITWEPWKGLVPDSAYCLQNIIDGDFDTYITTWAQGAKAFSKPLFLRFAHEMNGNWYPWDGAHNGSAEGAAEYISAWKHVHDIFDANGTNNVTWVWNVNATSSPDETWNSVENYYPGDAYVDWIGIDGYNWGSSSSSVWRDFGSIFSSVYTVIKARYPTKPIMIGEFACAPDGGDKAVWITDAFSKIKSSYSSVKVYNWFNITKEREWEVTSNISYKTAYKSAISDTTFFIDTATIP